MSLAAEAPKPPEDPELRNIIDKLAQFVARNGPDFENMTKQKQKDNPRFGFLFGGEYFHYYMYKVNGEQAIMRKQKIQAEQNSLAQIQTLQQQIHESEKNLKLQYDVLMQQQPNQIDDAIRIAEQEHLRDLANELKINFDDFSIALEQMHESCTKEAISVNKNWFFNHYSSQRHAEIILNYLVNKTKDPAVPFLFKLHLLYLVNDLTHHFMRKQNEQMLNLLGRFVVTMFTCAYTTHSADEQQKEKLEKLRSIWEAQRYFSDDTLKKLSNVQDTYSDYQLNLRQEYSSTITDVQVKIQSQYKQFEMQHLEYAKHIQQQISSLETRKINPPVTPFTPNLQLQSLSRGLLGSSPNTPPVLSGEGGNSVQPPPRRSRFDAGPLSVTGPLPVNIPPPAIAQPSLSVGARSNFPPMNQNAPPPMGNLGHGNMPPQMVPPWQQGPPPGAGPPPFNTRGPPPQMQNMVPPPMMYDFPPFPPNRNVAPPGMPSMNMPQQPPRPLFPPASGIGPPRLGGPPMGPGTSMPPWNPQMGPPPNAGGPLPGPGNIQSAWPPPNQGSLRPLSALSTNSPIRQQPPPIEDMSLIPKAAYYDLPAGLMVPLVKLEDRGYKSLDASKIRLPPPMPPSDRLLAAVEAFYAPPNHENPRDSEGWERLGLYEYFKAKQNVVQGLKKNEDGDGGRDHRNERRSPLPQQRRSRSYSRSGSRSRSRSRTESPRSRSRNSRSDSRSRHNSGSSRSRSRSRTKTRSRSRSASRSPDRRRHRRSRSLSHSRSPAPKFSSDRRRGESSSNINDGSSSAGSFYQGLGASSGNDDPFENFRKAQSGMFIQRIRAADPRTKPPPADTQI